ncbi:MAG TPA: MMPL family transporter [Candidatus Binatia bacterium]|nr:MMPL family transporter [Candidatus Binatia bacterium]
MLAPLARTVADRPWRVLAATLGATVCLALAAGRLVTRFDPESAFPADDPAVRIDREIRAEFGGRDTVVIAVVPRRGDVWQPDVLRAVQRITLDLRDRVPGVMAQQLVSLASPAVRRVEASDEGIREDYVMREVPETAAEIGRLRDIVRDNPMLRGGVVTEDERAAIVLADFWPGTQADAIAAGVGEALARAAGPSYTLHATGEPLIIAAEHAYLRHVPLYFGGAVGVMMVVLLVSFGTWQGMVLPILTGLLATTWGLGLMALTGVPLGLWNQAVPSLVIIVAAGHSAQMLKRYYEELAAGGDNRAAVVASVAHTGPVMVAAGATAALGFASLALLGVPGMADLGVSAAYGIGSAVVLELTFMPALRALLPAPRVPARAAGRTGALLGRLGAVLLAPAGRRTVLGIAMLVLAWAVAGVPRLRTGGTLRDELPAGHPVTRDLDAIRAHFPGTVTMTILFTGPPGSATAAATLAAVDRLAQALGADPDVARTASAADLVKEMNAAIAGGAWALPADPRLTAQLLFLGRGPAFERFVDRADARTVLWAYLRSDEPAEVARVLARAREAAARLALPAGVAVHVAGGVGPMLLAVEERVTRGKLLNVAAILLVVYAFSSLVLRTPVGGAFVVLPLVLAVAVVFGVLEWGGIRFDVVSATIAPIGVGIGADYAIYFLYRLREERRRGAPVAAALARALETSGRAVLFVALAIALGFTVFAPSPYRAFRLTGLLTPASMLASCLAAITVMPAALLALRPAFLYGRRDPPPVGDPRPTAAVVEDPGPAALSP